MVALTLALVVAACGGEDQGDEEAFCDLLRQGVGIGSDDAEVNPGDFALLGGVAPPEIRDAVRQLANTARSLDEITDDNLDELFSAAFDPDAVAARQALVAYAISVCRIDQGALAGGRIASDEVLVAEVTRYLEDRKSVV